MEGQPIPSQSVLRVLNSTGKNPPAVLQQADAYASPEEAAQAYAVAARTLGGCTMAATYIDSGAMVTGLGDSIARLVLNVADGNTSEFRTVMLGPDRSRRWTSSTWRNPPRRSGSTRSRSPRADVINAQCQAAAGRCASGVQAKASPPPVGGDAPGFLATADLPPVGRPPASWVGNKPAPPDERRTQGQRLRTSRLGQRGGRPPGPGAPTCCRTAPSKFGLDEVILTHKSPADATKLADKIRDDWADCTKRRLNARWRSPPEFAATGAQNTAIVGWTTSVIQKAGTDDHAGSGSASPPRVRRWSSRS